jgi:hypothetical protein
MWINELIFYEWENIPADPGYIALDNIILHVGPASDGPWTLIFYWGDTVSSNNGSVLPYHYASGEIDNERIPMSELYPGTGLSTGIIIPVGGTYQYVFVVAPPGCSDDAQIDALEVH